MPNSPVGHQIEAPKVFFCMAISHGQDFIIPGHQIKAPSFMVGRYLSLLPTLVVTAGRGEEGLERVHHAGGVESSQIDERVPDLTILPILTSTFSTRQYSPPQVRVSKPNFKKILQ